MANVFSDDQIQSIREKALSEGFSKLRDRIKTVEVDVPGQITEKKTVDPKYTKEDIANSMVSIYKDKIKPVSDTPYIENLPTHDPIDRSKEKEEANTIAKRANIRALSNSLANIRNGGYAGPTTEFTPSANGDVNPGRRCGYNALVVAGTEMTLEDYEEEINNRMEACWAGYKKKGMKTMFGKKYPNCVKEDESFDQNDDSHNAKGEKLDDGRKKSDKKDKRPQKVVKQSDGGAVYTRESEDVINEERYKKQRNINAYPARLRQALLNSSSKERDAAFEKYDKENPRKLPESEVVDELKDKLVEMDNHSWQSIDKVMRALAKEHDITPKELHKQFKAESNGMIPDDWAKKYAIREEAGFMPLSEAVALNQLGNVYEVSLMWRAHTRRLKFFWPEVGEASKEDMQRAVDMFYPGGKLISFYKSLDPGDNQRNFMVVVPPLRESVWLPENAWEQLSEEESLAYYIIASEEGEPVSPPMLSEDLDGFTLIVEDHDTGEEREVIYEKGSLHAWFNKSKSKDGKPGWVQSDGSTCARKPGQTSAPKCYSSQRLAGLKKTEAGRKKIRSADSRKKSQDSGQSSKSGAAKPTYVRTFKDSKDLKKHPSGDNYKDTKESFEDIEVPTLWAVWPSAYQTGELVSLGEDDMKGMTVKSGHKRSVAQGAGLTEKGAAAYRRKNPGSKLGTAVTTPPSKLKPGSKAAGRRKSFCARSRGWTGERGKAARARWNC